MKLPKNLLIKDTLSLFMGKYQYKIVLVSSVAHFFRNKKLDYAEKRFNEKENLDPFFKSRVADNRSFSLKVLNELKTFDPLEYDIRVEIPLINIYTNNKKHVESLTAIDPGSVKFVSLPNKTNPLLKKGDVIVKNLDFDYKIFMGNTRRNYKDFLNWTVNNDKIKVTKKCTKDLNKERSFGGSYFYVKGDKTLTMVKMFLGSDISRVENIIKA